MANWKGIEKLLSSGARAVSLFHRTIPWCLLNEHWTKPLRVVLSWLLTAPNPLSGWRRSQPIIQTLSSR